MVLNRKFDHISPVLQELGWSSIKHLLLVRDVTQLYKIVNGLTPSYLNCYISKSTGIHSYNTRFWENLDFPIRGTATAQRSFHYRSINTWNSLSSSTRKSKTLTSFKRGAKLELCHNENQVTDCRTKTVFICQQSIFKSIISICIQYIRYIIVAIFFLFIINNQICKLVFFFSSFLFQICKLKSEEPLYEDLIKILYCKSKSNIIHAVENETGQKVHKSGFILSETSIFRCIS